MLTMQSAIHAAASTGVSFLPQKARCAAGSQLDLAVSVFHMGITLN